MSITTMTPIYAWFAYYMRGFSLAYATTTTLTVGAGSCADSTNSNVITLETPVTLDLATKGPGGIDTGVLTASTWYAVYVIASTKYPGRANNSAQETYVNPYPQSAVLSKYVTDGVVPAPSLNSPYNIYRYVGSVYINASSQISNFVQTGHSLNRTMFYDADISVLAGGTSTTYANVDLTEAVPYPGVEVITRVTLTPATAASKTILAPFGSTSTNGTTVVKGQVAAVPNEQVLRCPCTSNAGKPFMLYKTTSGSDSVAISVSGYVERL